MQLGQGYVHSGTGLCSHSSEEPCTMHPQIACPKDRTGEDLPTSSVLLRRVHIGWAFCASALEHFPHSSESIPGVLWGSCSVSPSIYQCTPSSREEMCLMGGVDGLSLEFSAPFLTQHSLLLCTEARQPVSWLWQPSTGWAGLSFGTGSRVRESFCRNSARDRMVSYHFSVSLKLPNAK